jgi:hypothetical protein
MNANKNKSLVNNSSQQKCFFCRTGPCPAKRAKPGLELFCPCPLLPLPQKLPMPSRRTSPPSFCPFSPEAILLTLSE